VRIGRRTFGVLCLLFLSGCEPRGSQRTAHRFSLPWGALDRPAEGEILRGVTTIEGWAIAPDGVEKVSIYLDREFLTTARYGGERPDVQAAFPSELRARYSAYYAEIEARFLPPGRHLLIVQVRSTKGATRDVGSIAVTIEH
jgi:hypothetical protein